MIGPSVLMVMDAERAVLAAMPASAKTAAECLRFHDEARAAVERFEDEVDRVASFLVGYGNAADMAAERLRFALAEFRGKG